MELISQERRNRGSAALGLEKEESGRYSGRRVNKPSSAGTSFSKALRASRVGKISGADDIQAFRCPQRSISGTKRRLVAREKWE
ncbi:MAG: hypothetical protein ACLT0Y_01560 [Christensenellales bacterium]